MTTHSDPTPLPDASATPWLARALPNGTQVRGFEIIEVIAETASSVVYRASDRPHAAEVVLKEYLPLWLGQRTGTAAAPRTQDDASAYARGLRAFMTEGEMLAGVEHPALVRVLDQFEGNGTAYQVMPYRGGTPLMQARQQMRTPPDEPALRTLLADVLGAMHALHARGTVHGAITPRKILLLENGRPLLLGPDLARAETASDLVESLMAGVEPAFTAPEQRAAVSATSAHLGPWTDLYSLAKTLCFWLGNELPPPASALADIAPRESAAHQARRLLGDRVAGRYSSSLFEALDAALEPRPSARPQDVAAFQALLEARAPARTFEIPLGSPSDPDLAPPANAPIRREPAFGGLATVPCAPRPISAIPLSAIPPLPAPATKPLRPPAATSAATPRGSAPDAGQQAGHAAAPPATGAAVHTRTARAPRQRPHAEFWAGAALATLIAAGAFSWWRTHQPLEFELPTQPTGGAVVPPPVQTLPPTPPPDATAPSPMSTTPPPMPEALPTPAPAPAPDADTTASAPLPVPETDTAASAPPPTTAARPRTRAAARTATPAAPTAAASPRVACGERTPFAMYRCVQALCAQPGWARHAQCEHLRATDSVD